MLGVATDGGVGAGVGAGVGVGAVDAVTVSGQEACWRGVNLGSPCWYWVTRMAYPPGLAEEAMLTAIVEVKTLCALHGGENVTVPGAPSARRHVGIGGPPTETVVCTLAPWFAFPELGENVIESAAEAVPGASSIRAAAIAAKATRSKAAPIGRLLAVMASRGKYPTGAVGRL